MHGTGPVLAATDRGHQVDSIAIFQKPRWVFLAGNDLEVDRNGHTHTVSFEGVQQVGDAAAFIEGMALPVQTDLHG